MKMILLKFAKLIKQNDDNFEKYQNGEISQEDRILLQKAADKFIRIGFTLTTEQALWLTSKELAALSQARSDYDRDLAVMNGLCNLSPRDDEKAEEAMKIVVNNRYSKTAQINKAVSEAMTFALYGNN